MRINIESSALSEGRFHKLAFEFFEGSRSEAIGTLVLFWHDSQEREFISGSKEEVLKLLPYLTEDENIHLFDGLLKYDYLKSIGEGLYEISGNQKHVEKLQEFKARQSERGKKSAEIRKTKFGSATPFLAPNRTSEESAERHRSIARTGSEPGSNQVQTSSIQFNSIQCNSIQKKREDKKTKTSEKPASLGEQVALQEKLSNFLGVYRKAYKSRFGDKADLLLDGKTIGKIKNLLKRVELNKACDLIQVYFQLEDDWFKKKAYDFSTFDENLQKIATAMSTGRDPSKRVIDIERLMREEVNNAG